MGKTTKFTRRKLSKKFPTAYGSLPEIEEAAGGAGGGGRSLSHESTERLLKDFTKAQRAALTSADFVKLISGGGGGGGGGASSGTAGKRKSRKQRASRKQRR